MHQSVTLTFPLASGLTVRGIDAHVLETARRTVALVASDLNELGRMRDQYERCYLTGTVDGKLISLKGSLHLVEPLGDMRFLIDASEMVKAAAATRIEASLPVSITRSVSGERLDATAVRVSMECIVLDDNYLLEVGERLTLTLRIPDGDVTITPRGTVGVTEAGETLVNIDRECADAAAALAAHVLRVSREQLHRRRRGAAASEPDF